SAVPVPFGARRDPAVVALCIDCAQCWTSAEDFPMEHRTPATDHARLGRGCESYVGNRSAWWVSPLLAGLNDNALTPQGLLADRQYGATQGIDVTNKTDTALLNTQINSPLVIARYPLLANPNNVYAGFPSAQTLGQALRPYPQWGGIPPFLGP